MNVEFDVPVANISPRSSERPINLPSITYAVRATASCPELQRPESISISIADTRISIRPVDDEAIETTIRVSKKQLGPVTANDFCLTASDSVEIEPSASESIHIDNALSAQMSLRCVGENNESISYESAVLGVALQCSLPEPDEDSSSIVQ
ncbi:MAG: hypothetical protein ACR2QS_08510 [Woeseiaceae bacterium]